MLKFLKRFSRRPKAETTSRTLTLGQAANLRFLPQAGTGGYYDEYGNQLAGVARACIGRIAQRIVAADWRIVSQDGSPIEYRRRGVASSALLRNPGGIRYGRNEIYRHLAEQLLIHGNAFLSVRRIGDQIVGLSPVDYSHVWVVSQRGQPLAYNVYPTPYGAGNAPAGQRRGRSQSQILHARIGIINHESSLGSSPLATAAATCELYQVAQQSVLASLKNSVKMGGYFKLAEAVLDEDAHTSAIEQLRTELAKTENTGRTPLLPFGVDYMPPQKATTDIEMDKYLASAIEDIARIFGVPLALLQATGGSAASADELETRLIRDAVAPVAAAIADALTPLLIANTDQAGAFILPDLQPISGISPVSRAGLAMSMGQAGAFTIDEIRRLAGYGELPDGAGAELPSTAGAPEREGAAMAPPTPPPDMETGENENGDTESDSDPQE